MTEGGEAIPTVMIEDSADSMSAMVYYTNDAPGAVTLTAAAGEDLSGFCYRYGQPHDYRSG